MDDSSPSPCGPPPWLRGAMISGFGVLIGSAAFAYFCYALGLNFSDEGWSDGQPQDEINRAALAVSFAGFAIAILMFWIGFLRTTRTK